MGLTGHEFIPGLEDFGLEEVGCVVRGEGLVYFEFGYAGWDCVNC